MKKMKWISLTLLYLLEIINNILCCALKNIEELTTKDDRFHFGVSCWNIRKTIKIKII